MAIVKFSTIREGKSPASQDGKGRESMLVLFDKSTDLLIKFKGYDIKNVAKITDKAITKGPFPSIQYTIQTELQGYRWTQDFESNKYVPYGTWQAAYKGFVKESKFDVSFGAFENFIREVLPDAATVMDENQLAMSLKEPSKEVLLKIKEAQAIIAEHHRQIADAKEEAAMQKKAEDDAARRARIQATIDAFLESGKSSKLEELQTAIA